VDHARVRRGWDSRRSTSASTARRCSSHRRCASVRWPARFGSAPHSMRPARPRPPYTRPGRGDGQSTRPCRGRPSGTVIQLGGQRPRGCRPTSRRVRAALRVADTGLRDISDHHPGQVMTPRGDGENPRRRRGAPRDLVGLCGGHWAWSWSPSSNCPRPAVLSPVVGEAARDEGRKAGPCRPRRAASQHRPRIARADERKKPWQ
jgi:hypothetical protein